MATCYCRDNGGVLSQADGRCGGATPCGAASNGGFVQCCGAGASCGSDGFCFWDGPTDGGLSGYYMAGCTDPSFADASCPRPCTDRINQNVVYLASKQKWACCATSSSFGDCSAPSNETFSAPEPDRLTFHNASSSAPGSSPSTSATSTALAAAASSSSSKASAPGVPTSTIALAAILPIVVLIAIALLVLLLRRRRASTETYRYSHHVYPPFDPQVSGFTSVSTNGNWKDHATQLGGRPIMSELDHAYHPGGRPNLSELDHEPRR